jgi:DNA-3-methyladenine glycosylase II
MPTQRPGTGATLPSGPARLECTVELPADFRPDDFLTFHRRDTQQIAETVTTDGLIKGVVWANLPARLSIQLQPRKAEVRLDLDGAPDGFTAADLAYRAHRMLGLTQPIHAFERRFLSHPQLGSLIRRHPGLRVPMAASPFEALSWAVIGQQISLSAAISIRRRLIQAAAVQHVSGLWCYPDASAIARLSCEQLRAAGLSATKAATLSAISTALQDGRLDLSCGLDAGAMESLRTRLLQIKGIGPWTVNYTLLRGFGWLDGSLHGDVAVRRSLQELLQAPQKFSEAQAQAWLAAFSPWRALVAAHLWNWYAASAEQRPADRLDNDIDAANRNE